MTYPGSHDPPIIPAFPPPPYTPPPPPRRSRAGLIVVAVLAVVVLLAGGVALGVGLTRHGASTAASTSPSPAWSPIDWGKQTPAAVVPPKPTDFTLAVKVLTKACFGSAGCNITYRINPTYTGAPFRAGAKFEVVYQITGGRDGPQINRFTIGAGSGPGNAWEASVQDEELIQVKSSSVVLTAEVTDVSQV